MRIPLKLSEENVSYELQLSVASANGLIPSLQRVQAFAEQGKMQRIQRRLVFLQYLVGCAHALILAVAGCADNSASTRTIVDADGSSFGIEHLPHDAVAAVAQRGRTLNFDDLSPKERRRRWLWGFAVWERDGQRIVEMNYDDGRPKTWFVERKGNDGEWHADGPGVLWDKRGEREEGLFQNGEPHGEFRTFDTHGQLVRVVQR